MSEAEVSVKQLQQQVESQKMVPDYIFFFFNDTATTEIYTLSLHDALPISGAKGKRFSLPHARILIHQPLGGFQGQATDIDIHAREILRTRDKLNELLDVDVGGLALRSEEHTSELQSLAYLVCRLLLEKKKH